MKKNSVQKKKRRALEAPKGRIFLLFVMIALFIAAPMLFSSIPKSMCILLGIFSADLLYYLFVVLKVHQCIAVSIKGQSAQEKAAHQQAMEIARETSRRGIVLLKNDAQVLPLAPGSRLNLLGLRSVQMNYNGGGSAASDESKCTALDQALRECGFEINTELLNLSLNYLKNGNKSIADPGKTAKVRKGSTQKGGAEFVSKPGDPVKKEIPIALLRDCGIYPDGRSPMEHAREFSDTALIVISRGGGEGYDYDPYDLCLMEDEKALLEETAHDFDKIIVIINSANCLELGLLKEMPAVKGILWIGFPGSAGNLALGDILNGTVNPSGHLPDTWPASNCSAPAANNFRERQADGTWAKESFHYRNAPEKTGYFVHYSEGIYVGYRYYETKAAVDPSYPYEKEVLWPFGYGLSYSEFEQKILHIAEQGDELSLLVSVRNIGKVSGEALVQCYYTPPYFGTLEKSAVNLVAYEKTGCLQPAASVELTLQIPKKDLSSFSEKCGSWVLEKGAYELTIRSDSHHILDRTEWTCAESIRFEGTGSLFADAATEPLNRSFSKDHRAFAGPSEADYIAAEDVLEALHYHVPTDKELGLSDCPPTGVNAGLKLKDVSKLPIDDAQWDLFIRQFSVKDLCNLCGNGAWHTPAIKKFGVPETKAPDGSTCIGATVFSALVMRNGKAGITWPCPPVLAAAFDKELAQTVGERIGTEGRCMGYQGWYAPALNCHRTAFNSRNFEYYSEDPFLSGKTGANVTLGVQKQGVMVYLKHFALNEREANARNQLFTWCSEQAIREIYLRPFEIAVKEGKALGIMSSFNYIGHTWAGGNKALLDDLLRKEWGFQGAVVTDACLYPHMDVEQMVYAGGNLALDSLGGFTGGNGKRRNLLAAAQDPERKNAMVIWLQKAAKGILYAISRTNAV